jgi:FPC/CPF motif-containing protein YcgG
VADGYEVDPEALRVASRACHAGADAVEQAAVRLSTAQLVPGSLGEVDAAHELAAAFADFAGRHADDLRRGHAWMTGTADGLVATADGYVRRDVFPR